MIAPAFAPKNNPEAVVNAKLVLAFLSKGFEVDVISNGKKSNYAYTQEIDRLWLPLINNIYEIEVPSLKKIARYADLFKCVIKTGQLIEGCRWAYYAYKKALELTENKKYNVIISRAMPDVAHLPALLLSKKKGIKWIANWNDPHPEKAPHPWERIRGFSFFKSKYNKALINNIDWHTFPSNKMRTYMADYLSKKILERSSVFPHIGLSQKIVKTQDLRYFKICYAGALYKGRDPSSLFNAISEILDETVRLRNVIKIVLLGDFSNWIIDLIEKYHLGDNVIIQKSLCFSNSLDFISEMDLLFLLETDYTDGIFLPSKMVDYYQVNRPILAIGPENSEVQGILIEHGGGIYFTHKDTSNLKSKIYELIYMWENKELNSIIENSTLSKVFDPEELVNQYEILIKTLLNSGSVCNNK